MDFKTMDMLPKMNWEAADLAAEFRKFKNKCQIVFGSVLRNEPEEAKVQYFKLFIGDRGLEIFDTMKWRDASEAIPASVAQDGVAVSAQPAIPAENTILQSVMQKFEQYVEPRRGEIRATSLFMKRWQQPEEPFDKFVTDLKVLIKDCNYGDNSDRMIRDAIAIRSYDIRVREKCLEKDPSLTLEQAIRIGQNQEVAKSSLKFIDENRGADFNGQSVNLVHKCSTNKSDNEKEPNDCFAVSAKSSKIVENCAHCSRKHIGECRFKNFKGKCHNCGKSGHIKPVCPNKTTVATNSVKSDTDNDS